MILLNDYKGFKIWARYYIEKLLPKIFYTLFVKYAFFRDIHKLINLSQPKTFSDKLNYLKLYDNSEQKTLWSDKLWAKEYINKNIPDLKTAKVYQSAFSFEKLDFSLCPETFMIKTNHACKTGILVRNKNELSETDYKKYKQYYDKVLKINYAYWGTFELQYKDIVPKVYTEEYWENPNSEILLEEYEVWCFNGNPEFIKYVSQTSWNLNVTYLDTDWKKSKYDVLYRYFDVIPDDYNKKKILEYSKYISKDFKFARVDFFEVNKELYFGEVTFTPYSGHVAFVPKEYDEILGQKLII